MCLVRARSHCTGRCKEDSKRKKNLNVLIKTLCIRCVLIEYVFHTLYLSSIRTLLFHPPWMFWTAQNILPPFTMSIYNIDEQQVAHVRYYLLNVCGIFFASSTPLTSHPCPWWWRRGGGEMRYTERLFIIGSTDVERCKRMHLVIIVCIPCVYLWRTWYVRFIR